MKSRFLTLLPALALTLLFAGCASTPGTDSEGGAAVGEPGQGGSEGATTAGAREGGSWSGNPFEDPDSLLSTQVIYFDFDTSEIRSDYQNVIVAHGEYLAANPTVSVTVQGHADERGSREYNIGLGERRANAVRRLLLTQGAFDTQIITVSYGEERPVDMGSNETAWAKNRRAELHY
ncbi:MAG: peptidoglycan-associated lipoprotein Pal [Gammaproteobacteria bacterium]|nr:peptidoglycan-associated lipoprotein Pal [Gammaproteobacteria bacterium]